MSNTEDYTSDRDHENDRNNPTRDMGGLSPSRTEESKKV